MRFRFVDAVLEQSADRVVTLKRLSATEEYLKDHFAAFPVMPGVLMLESMVQAARLLLEPGHHASDLAAPRPWVLTGVRALKFGRFVRPGDALRVEVTRDGIEERLARFRGRAWVVTPGAPDDAEPALGVSGRFDLRPATLGAAR